MNIDVFISHSSEDAEIANEICDSLEANNIKCWLAPRDILPGSDWAEAINNAIENSKAMVLVFSKNSNTSTQVAKELSLAINNKLVVLPFKIDASTPMGSMKYYLSDTHWLDTINGDMKDKIKNLTDVLIPVLPHTTSDTEDENNFDLEQTEPQPAHKISWKSIVIICEIILIVVITAALWRSSTNIQKRSANETEIIKRQYISEEYHQADENPSYRFFRDEENGYEIDYPLNFEQTYDKSTEEYSMRKWENSENTAMLCVITAKNTKDVTMEKLKELFAQAYDGEITYSVLRENWFVISINDSLYYHYAYYKFDENKVKGFEFHFSGPENLPIYSKYIDHIYESFKSIYN